MKMVFCSAYFGFLALLCILLCSFRSVLCAAPVGCALDDTASLIGRYDCDFNEITLPLTMTDFSSPDPQRIRIYNTSGTFPSPSFAGFGSFNTGTLDTDYPASLEIECVNGGTLTISAGTFDGMGYLQDFYITNCDITDLPTDVFADFGTLNYFKIEGGSIATTQSNSLNGMNILRSGSPTPLGEFVIYNVPITSGVLASGFLDPITTVSVLILENIGLSSIDVSTFSQNTIVRNLSIAGNELQEFPNNLFSGLDGLMFLNLKSNPLNCSCSDVWFLDYLADQDVKVVGAAVCEEPASYNLQRATKYHDENCPYDPCGSIPGINADPLCYTIFQLFGYVIICGSCVMALVSIYLYLNARVHIALPKYRLNQKKKKAWIKVQDSLYKGVVNMVPPASTGAKGSRLPPILRAVRKRMNSVNEIQPFPPSYSDLEKEDIANNTKRDVITSDSSVRTGNSIQLDVSADITNQNTETHKIDDKQNTKADVFPNDIDSAVSDAENN